MAKRHRDFICDFDLGEKIKQIGGKNTIFGVKNDIFPLRVTENEHFYGFWAIFWLKTPYKRF
jgi:hypothetical protein